MFPVAPQVFFYIIHNQDVVHIHSLNINPRTAGVWLVTRPAGGGGGGKAPSEISQTTGAISKFQMPLDSPRRELPEQGIKVDIEVTDDITGQVKVRIFDFSGFLTSASKIWMLSKNKNRPCEG